MFKKSVVLFLLLFVPLMVYAQSIGKIVGVVKDKSTGEPLPGVNVVVEGTVLGASTDIDGFYVILNVPVGVYKLHASYIGYKDVVVENVRVSANITTEVNFEMEPTALELGEAIVVTAERPLVEKHVTQSISIMTSKEIENIPVRGLGALLQLQNSVVVQNGQIHIRGGRNDEVGYYLDGASVVNPLNNNPVVFVIQEAVEEFQVLAGGYTAEFGGANAGIIRTELKTGTPELHFSVDFQSDEFTSPGKKFLDTYTYHHHIGVATVSGSVPGTGKKVRFFLAAENRRRGDRVVRFSKGYRFENLIENPADATAMADGKADTLAVMEYPDGFTPRNRDVNFALNGTLLFDFQPLRFRMGGAFNTSKTYTDAAPMLHILNNRQGYWDGRNLLLTGKLTYIFSPTTFVEWNVNYLYSKNENKDDWFGNDWKKWDDSLAVARYTNGEVHYRSRWSGPYPYRFYGFTFSRPGTPPFGRYNINKTNQIGTRLDFVSQFNRYNELKAGIEARYYTYRQFGVNVGAISLLKTYGSLSNVPIDQWVRQGFVDNIGYDVYGNENNKNDFDNFLEGPRHPLFFAAYVQDKIEFADLIINAGIRFDYFDTDDRTLTNYKNPPNTQGRIKKEAWKDVKPYSQVSPRLGVSFPVSSQTVFYFQYGKFIQMPELSTIYRSLNDYDLQIVRGGFFFLNPVGFGLEPIRTTSYEIGFRQQLSHYAAFDITGFYRNVKGQIQVDKVLDVAPGLNQYIRLINGDFATTKGLEFKLTLRRVNRIQAQFNYTYTDAKGTGSNRTSYIGAVERETQPPTTIQPLDYSQTHTGALMLDYRFGKGDGGPVLERSGVNLVFTFSSGHPYTRVNPLFGGQVDPYTAGVDYMLDTRSRKALEPINNSRTPWTFNVDLRVDKTITVANLLDVTFYVRVTNLFNTKNVLNVYEMTGSATDDGFLSNRARSQAVIDANGGQRYIEMYRAINLENGQAYWSSLGRQLFSRPRQIFFGIKFSY